MKWNIVIIDWICLDQRWSNPYCTSVQQPSWNCYLLPENGGQSQTAPAYCKLVKDLHSLVKAEVGGDCNGETKKRNVRLVLLFPTCAVAPFVIIWHEANDDSIDEKWNKAISQISKTCLMWSSSFLLFFYFTNETISPIYSKTHDTVWIIGEMRLTLSLNQGLWELVV